MLTRSLADIYASARSAPRTSAAQNNPLLAATNGALAASRNGSHVAPQAQIPNYVAALIPGAHLNSTATQSVGAGNQNMGVANGVTPSGTMQINPSASIQNMPATQAPGMVQQQIGAQNPNQQQLSPQAQALFAELQRRADLAKTQAGQLQLKTQDNGVFAGGQKAPQSAGPPQMSLPQLYAGGR